MLSAGDSELLGAQDMTNPLTSLTKTVIMGVALTVIIVAILYGIS